MATATNLDIVQTEKSAPVRESRDVRVGGRGTGAVGTKVEVTRLCHARSAGKIPRTILPTCIIDLKL